MATFVKEYDWMWLPSGLGLSPAECRVYAYIYGLTEGRVYTYTHGRLTECKHSKTKGYKGSVRQLAKALGLDDSGVSRILRKLQDKQLVLADEGAFMSADIFRSSADSVRSDTDSVRSDTDSVRESADSVPSPLTTPLYKEINKEMERDNTIARNTIATQDAQTPFSEYKESYILAALEWHDGIINGRAGAENWFKYRGAFAEELWAHSTEVKRKKILAELKNRDGFWRKNPEFLLQDYPEPMPKDYNGSPDLNRMAENNEMVVAVFREVAGIYTKQDAEDYGMKILRPFQMQ